MTVEILPSIEKQDYDQFRGILEELPPTYAEWLEIRKNMRANLERPYKHDYSEIEIRYITISPDEFAKHCTDWGGCRRIDDLYRCAIETAARLDAVAEQNHDFDPLEYSEVDG